MPRTTHHAPEPPSMVPPSTSSGLGLASGSSSESELIARARMDAEGVIRRNGDPFHASPMLPPPDSIPGYIIEREIHRGGQGVVYLAQRASTGRRVAIKVPRDGPFADAREVLRFEREMQILSRLEHPNIVRILDRGVAHGQHWFAMPHIDGPSLDRWLTDGERTRTEILGLFRKLCGAVHEAHLQGVIHRDLKPSNIRVDASGEPHILDFGLARASGDAAQVERTATGEFIGTPAWASPEQVARSPNRIDQRTDVYLLGLILFKLLTGRSPSEFTGQHRELRAMLHAMLPAPSSVRRGIDGELDTIVETCLAPEPNRRYQSVHALSRDIDRYLHGEPIEARRDSRWYLLLVFLRRYRRPLLAAVLVVAAMTSLSVLSTVQWLRAEQASAQERAAWRQAEEALRASSEARLAAQRNSAMFDAASSLFIDEPLDGAEGVEPDDDGQRMADILARGASRIGTLFTDPEVQADFHARFGRTFKSLRQWEPAIEHLRRAIELEPAEDEVRAALLEDLGFALVRSGQAAEALAVQEEALALRQAASDDPSVAVARSLLGVASAKVGLGEIDGAIEADRAAIAMLTDAALVADGEGPITLDLARAEATLALHLRRLSERRGFEDRRALLLEEAARLGREVVALYESEPLRGPTHPVTLQAMNNLAMCLREAGEIDAAVELWSTTVARWSQRGEGQPGSIAPIYNLAGTLAYRLDRTAEALPLATEALAIRRRTLRPDHVELGRALSLVAFCRAETLDGLQPMQRLVALSTALGLLEESIAIHRRQPGGKVPALVRALRARCLLGLVDPDERPVLLEELRSAKEEMDRDLPATDPHRVRTARWLTEALASEPQASGDAAPPTPPRP